MGGISRAIPRHPKNRTTTRRRCVGPQQSRRLPQGVAGPAGAGGERHAQAAQFERRVPPVDGPRFAGVAMLRALLAKDLRRVRRNPLPWLINLIVPLCMTALIGLAFGGKSDSGQLGRIHFAVVDEDKTRLSDFLRGSTSQREGGKYLDPVFLDRDEALRQINDDKLAAILIIPTNFTRNYLGGSNAVSLELIKNPAQSIHPAVMEEL